MNDTPDERTPYEGLGGDRAVRDLVDRFYDLMDLEPAYAELRRTHGSELTDARDKLYWFLSGWLGGPDHYIERFGHPRLRARHLPFAIGIQERDQWLACMNQAMRECEVDEELRLRLLQAFFKTADWMRNQARLSRRRPRRGRAFMPAWARVRGRSICCSRAFNGRNTAMARQKDDRQDTGVIDAPMKEPKPPFAKQHQESPGIESELEPKPRYQAERYRPAAKLEGLAAVITGGDSGIGRAVAVLFAREGADVAIAYLPEEEADAMQTKAEVERAGRRCLLLPGDLRDPGYCDDLIEDAVREFGRLDILVSNAAYQARKSLEELSDEELAKTFETNFYAYVRLSRAALRHMLPGASIIATSSETGILGSKQLPDYSATKGAINAFTKTLSMQLVEREIRVNAIAPGPVWTPLNPSDSGADEQKVSTFGSDSPMKRPAQPEELAPAYVFLASNADSSYITGIVLEVMGGETTG
jgi:NAD(P)-dependent dehydrogenase (short-subunit alcohol dehydrogenase family)/truncated hemoglobin YjbI